nr:2OG-Fe(II) oxygenase [Novosphingobium sp. KN65.2]
MLNITGSLSIEMPATPHPDCRALARIGASVRERLSGQPAVRRLPIEAVEIYTSNSFLSASDCAHIMALIDTCACPSRLLEEEGWDDYRTSYSGDIDTQDRIVRDLELRLSDFTGIAPSCGESAQGQRYERGQYFNEHCDWFDTEAGYWRQERRCGGQRSWTAMIYLNAVEEGGRTDFTHIGLSIPPEPGCLLLWNNALPDGTPNPLTMHAARPVIRGVKYVVTKWFRVRNWQ